MNLNYDYTYNLKIIDYNYLVCGSTNRQFIAELVIYYIGQNNKHWNDSKF